MSKDSETYVIEITIQRNGVSDAAKHLIPRLIREFGTIMKTKMALVASDGQWSIEARVHQPGAHFAGEDFPLVPNEDIDNPER